MSDTNNVENQTLLRASISAPYSRRMATVEEWPFLEASMSGVCNKDLEHDLFYKARIGMNGERKHTKTINVLHKSGMRKKRNFILWRKVRKI